MPTPISTPGKAMATLLFAALCFIAPFLRAAEVTSLSVSYATTGVYVIDSDASNAAAGYDRDAIPMSVTVGLDGTPFTEPMRDFRVRFRMFDTDGNEVALVAGTQFSNVILWPTAFSAGPFPGRPLPSSLAFTGAPKPSTRLDANKTYRIEAQVQRWDTAVVGGFIFTGFHNLGSPAFSPFRRFYHFINTIPNDPQRNVIARMATSASYSRRFAIASSAGQKEFLVNAPYQLRRYDNYTAGSPTDATPVQIVWTVRLFREAGAVDVEVPLQADPSFETPVVVPFYVAGTPRTPALVSGNATLRLRPTIQLDSRETYYTTVTISHRELPAPAAPVVSNATSTPAQRLLHFSGRLDFGSVQTTIEEISGDPAPGSALEAGSPAPSVLCTPQIVLGRLAAPNNNHTYSGALAVRLLPDGRAVYNNAAATVPVTAPTTPDKDRENGIAFVRLATTLSTTGASATIGVLTPAGMIITAAADAKIGLAIFSVGPRALSSSLRPTDATLAYTPASPVHVAEETKPVQMAVSSITWVRAQGRLDLATTGATAYTQTAEMAQLTAAPVPAAQKIKRSNERYFAAVNGMLSSGASIHTNGANNGARLTAAFSFGAIDFRTHFPHDVRVVSSGGRIAIAEDAISPAAADSRMEGVVSVSLQYQQACVQGGCSGVAPRYGDFRLRPNGQQLRFTADGGFVAEGEFDTTYLAGDRTNLLEWGYIGGTVSNPRYAHALQNRFTKGAFHATGHFLRGPAAPADSSLAPGVVHLTGFHASNPAAAPERPGSAAYQTGAADYAGINLRASQEATPRSARSIVANVATPAYPLKARSKYYVRRSGNAGIHDAAQTPGDFVLYGFPVSFANFSFGFRETQNVSSATLGQIVVPYPSDFVQPFEELILTCLGDIKEAKIPEEGGRRKLVYWDAEFQPYTFEIQKEDSCSPGGNAILAMMIQAHAHHVPVPLEGKVGWYPNGDIVPKSAPNYTVTSRFPLPATLKLAGPGGESYHATTVGEAYFNSHANLASNNPIGFVSFPVRVSVPSFEDLRVHVHTFARPFDPPAGAPPSRLHLMGGWTEGGKTFFTDPNFDPSHRGYPAALPVATYRNEGANRLPSPGAIPADDPFSQYRVYARRGFLNEDKFFEYPIEFISGARVWTSSAPQKNDILVFNVSHQLDRLSPQHADITFGVSHSGLPALSLSNSAFSFTDEVAAGNPAAGGFRNIVAGVLGTTRMNQLNGGLAALGEVTGDRFDLFADHFISHAVNPRLTTAYQQLKTAYNSGSPWPSGAGAAVTTFENGVEGRLALTTLTANPAGLGGPDLSLLNATRGKLSTALTQAIEAMDVLVTGNQALFSANNNHAVTRQLVRNLVQQGSPEAGAIVAQFAGPLLDSKILELTQRGAPTIGDVRFALAEVRARLVELRTQVNATNSEFSQALRKIVQDAAAEATHVATQARNEMMAIATNEPAKYFNQLPQSAFEDRVRNRLRSRLMSRNMTSQLLGVMRQYLYDLDAQARTSVDSGFQVTNRIVRNVLAEAIETANPSYANALGGLSSCLGAADIDGYARMNGDTLRTLRLDMKARMDLMSEMKADFYLQIDCLQSEGDEACSWAAPGKYYTEVRLGADNVEAEWLGDMRLNVGLKCTLSDNGGLLGMGGSIELAAGKAKFEKFAITEFGATAMFGQKENYVGAKARAEFNKKALKVGFFFGRTCSVDPLKLVDRDVAKVLGSPPFTGGYVYGEMSYPLNEILGIPSTCFLSLTGTVGAGIWVFIENPEFGGKLYLKIVGEVICIAEIGGEITLLGGKSGNDYVLSGKGRLWVEVCFFFCFEGRAGVRVKCRNSDCDFDIDI